MAFNIMNEVGECKKEMNLFANTLDTFSLTIVSTFIIFNRSITMFCDHLLQSFICSLEIYMRYFYRFEP
jgi:hypothetical protein